MKSHIKRNFIVLLFLLLVCILIGCSKADTSTNEESSNSQEDSNEDPEEVFEIEVGNWAPSTHHFTYNVFEPWKEFVEEKTEGRVKVNLYHGAALGAATSVYQDVSGGLYDFGIVVAAYFYDTAFFPYTIGQLPFAFSDVETAAKILEKFGEKYANDKLTDVVIAGTGSSDPYDLFSTTPVRTASDLKNLKMRISGKVEQTFVENLGGVPVSLALGETYEGLQRNTINTSFYTPIGAVGLKLFEPAPYITKVGALAAPAVTIMNPDFFESLPEDLQTLFVEELNPKFIELLVGTYTTELEESYKILEEELKGRGEIINLPEKELETIRKAGKGAWDDWIEDANEKGYPGEEMVDFYFKLLEEEGFPTPF